MKKIFAALVVCLLPCSAMAQTGQAYVVAGPGNFKGDHVNYAAFGGEYISRVGVGVAGEVNWLWALDAYRAGERPLSTLLTGFHVSFPLAAHYSTARVQPFVIAGVSYIAEPIGDSTLWYMFGGGANVWISRHAAIRGELRLPQGSTRTGPIGVFGVTVR